jgi:hypothetical protein
MDIFVSPSIPRASSERILPTNRDLKELSAAQDFAQTYLFTVNTGDLGNAKLNSFGVIAKRNAHFAGKSFWLMRNEAAVFAGPRI